MSDISIFFLLSGWSDTANKLHFLWNSACKVFISISSLLTKYKNCRRRVVDIVCRILWHSFVYCCQ